MSAEPTTGSFPFHTADTRLLTPTREIWGWGIRRVIQIPAPWPDHLDAAKEALAADELAIGAFPFERAAAATLLVPAKLLVRSPAPAPNAPLRSALTDPGLIDAVPDRDTWRDLVAEATRRINAGELTKVVLARRVTVNTTTTPVELANRLFAQHTTGYRYLVDRFVGASPELLVSRQGDVVRAEPMAGTLPLTGDPDADAAAAARLLNSHKDRLEHQITIDALLDGLISSCSYADSEPEPHVAAAGTVQHLATRVEGRLAQPPAHILDLVARLHPTPAVGGSPTVGALELIRELEPFERGRYAGAVGWVDGKGDGEWAVAIRCAELSDAAGGQATLHAGVGVVADSDPAAELAETDAKLRTMLGALGDAAGFGAADRGDTHRPLR